MGRLQLYTYYLIMDVIESTIYEIVRILMFKNENANKINLLNYSQYINGYINETWILSFSLNEPFDSNIHLDASTIHQTRISTCSGK